MKKLVAGVKAEIAENKTTKPPDIKKLNLSFMRLRSLIETYIYKQNQI